jgi:hypothetical protein
MKRIDAATAQRIASVRAERLTEILKKQQERISGGALVILPGP